MSHNAGQRSKPSRPATTFGDIGRCYRRMNTLSGGEVVKCLGAIYAETLTSRDVQRAGAVESRASGSQMGQFSELCFRLLPPATSAPAVVRFSAPNVFRKCMARTALSSKGGQNWTS